MKVATGPGLGVDLDGDYLKAHLADGWAKLHASDGAAPGAANIQWHAASCVLLCRVATRKRSPSEFAGRLLAYLLLRHRQRIQAVHIVHA